MLCRKCQDRRQCLSCEWRLAERQFLRRRVVSRVHESSTKISGTAPGIRYSDGSRSSYELQQRVLRRIPRDKRRRRPRRSEKLQEQTRVLTVYSALTFKSVDFKAMHHVSFLAHDRCRYTAGCARVGRSGYMWERMPCSPDSKSGTNNTFRRTSLRPFSTSTTVGV